MITSPDNQMGALHRSRPIKMDSQPGSPLLASLAVAVLLPLLAVVPVPLAACENPASTKTAVALSCPMGLVIYLEDREAPEANVLRMPSGLELRVSEPILTLTRSMIQGAEILEYHEYHTPEERVRGTPTKKHFWVTLSLTPTASARVSKAIRGREQKDMVAGCDGVVLVATATGDPIITSFGVLVGDSADRAEQLARSFTQNVHFEKRTPRPDRE